MNLFFLFVYFIKTAVPCGMLDSSSKAKFGSMMTHFPPALPVIKVDHTCA